MMNLIHIKIHLIKILRFFKSKIKIYKKLIHMEAHLNNFLKIMINKSNDLNLILRCQNNLIPKYCKLFLNKIIILKRPLMLKILNMKMKIKFLKINN